MAETSNYGLYLTEDATVNFLDWREKLAGQNNSNMTIIDEALAKMCSDIGTKAKASTYVNATLLSTGWTGTSAPYSQTITVSGLGVDQNGFIQIAQGATADQREAVRLALLGVTGQSSGKLTISADGDKPSTDIPVTVILLG